MTKEEARAYIEILDNLKRDLVEDSNEKDVSLIREKLEGFASGVYTKEGDELIVIPSSALDEIFNAKKRDCRKCCHLVSCEFGKMAFHKASGIECDEFEEANNGKNRI